MIDWRLHQVHRCNPGVDGGYLPLSDLRQEECLRW